MGSFRAGTFGYWVVWGRSGRRSGTRAATQRAQYAERPDIDLAMLAPRTLATSTGRTGDAAHRNRSRPSDCGRWNAYADADRYYKEQQPP